MEALYRKGIAKVAGSRNWAAGEAETINQEVRDVSCHRKFSLDEVALMQRALTAPSKFGDVQHQQQAPDGLQLHVRINDFAPRHHSYNSRPLLPIIHRHPQSPEWHKEVAWNISDTQGYQQNELPDSLQIKINHSKGKQRLERRIVD